MEIERKNALLLSRLSAVLNKAPDLFGPEDVAPLTESGFGRAEAMGILLAGAMDLYEDREIRDIYLPGMVRELDPAVYREDPYYRAVGLPEESEDGRWSLRREAYKPYELFVCGDYRYDEAGRVFPQIGFFPETFRYPAVLQDGREWMLITPNEIETMRRPIGEARGRVVTYGLGLGYFAYMAARKPEVEQVTVVERDPAVIRLFRSRILPKLSCGDKIRILQGDAFAHAAALAAEEADFVFADIWHDAGDGLPMWQRLRTLEKPGITYRYWIEETMRYYL